MQTNSFLKRASLFCVGLAIFLGHTARLFAADKLNLIYTARVMSQAYPWMAQDLGLFKKYDLDVPVVFVTPGAPSAARLPASPARRASVCSSTRGRATSASCATPSSAPRSSAREA